VSELEVHVTADSHFSWLRTRMSAERTLMSWLRTAASMIGFGFTIVQFFARFADLGEVAPAHRPHAPRTLGLLLIAAGVVALVNALIQFRSVTRHLDDKAFADIRSPHYRSSPTVLLAGALVLIGVFAFASIVIRLD